jgi:hypothetical protein
VNELKWSKTEKVAAKRAFEAAYQRECEALARKLKEMAAAVKDPVDLWRIHDFLTEQRKEIDGKYDYRYSVLVLVFTRLLRERWLEEADLEGLGEDKVEKIKYLADR